MQGRARWVVCPGQGVCSGQGETRIRRERAAVQDGRRADVKWYNNITTSRKTVLDLAVILALYLCPILNLLVGGLFKRTPS